MSAAQKMSLYYKITSLNKIQFDVVSKMLQGLLDESIEIEELSSEEAAVYADGFSEMEQGQYVTLDDIRAKRNA